MRILHYSLGFPPYRRGGLTKYCIDVMTEQTKVGHDVAMLWPGDMGILLKKSTRIVKQKPYKVGNLSIENYEFQGCLPVPLLEGVSVPHEYTANLDIKPFIEFISSQKPEIVHFHTLMGIPQNYLQLLKDKGIKTVFTTHDYYGLCPRTTLIRGKRNCNDYICENCGKCNRDAASIEKIRILQSSLYRNLKDTLIVKELRKRHWKLNEMLVEKSDENFSNIRASTREYVKLRKYYVTMLELFDVVHFNSSNTQKIYCSYSVKIKGEVLSISHRDISDNRKKRVRHEICQFTYLGPDTYHKGFYLLIDVCDRLWRLGYKFKLNIYFRTDKERPYLEIHKPYNYGELGVIMDNTDYVVVPSLWNETYGFTVAEAMSYGIPAIVSTTVGAKDEIETDVNGIITEATFTSLYNIFIDVIEDTSLFDKYNANICKNYIPRTISTHCQNLLSLYN